MAPLTVPPAMVCTNVAGVPDAGCAKLADTVEFAPTVTRQVDVAPVESHPDAPVHPPNVQAPPVHDPEGVSVNVTAVPLLYVAEQVPESTPAVLVQLIPPTLLVTVPMP